MRPFYKLFLAIDVLLAAVSVFGGVRSLTLGRPDDGWKALLSTLVWIGFARFCYTGILHHRKEQAAFIARLEGRDIGEALSIARGEAVVLPPGLVAQKVDIPFERWFAFERDSFQFVLASDDQGRARAFPI